MIGWISTVCLVEIKAWLEVGVKRCDLKVIIVRDSLFSVVNDLQKVRKVSALTTNFLQPYRHQISMRFSNQSIFIRRAILDWDSSISRSSNEEAVRK